MGLIEIYAKCMALFIGRCHLKLRNKSTTAVWIQTWVQFFMAEYLPDLRLTIPEHTYMRFYLKELYYIMPENLSTIGETVRVALYQHLRMTDGHQLNFVFKKRNPPQTGIR